MNYKKASILINIITFGVRLPAFILYIIGVGITAVGEYMLEHIDTFSFKLHKRLTRR